MAEKKPPRRPPAYDPPAVSWPGARPPLAQAKPASLRPGSSSPVQASSRTVVPPPPIRAAGAAIVPAPGWGGAGRAGIAQRWPIAGKTARIPPPPPRTGAVIQRADMGFSGLKEPSGYGSVSLSATLNGADIGKAWSKKTTYCLGTEHAEDAVVDYIEMLETYAEFASARHGADEGDLKLAASLALQKTLVIHNLTASPCSSTLGTCTKQDKFTGCTERLIALRKRGYTITITADHYYQPTGVEGGKEKSKEACAAMAKAGIGIKVTNP